MKIFTSRQIWSGLVLIFWAAAADSAWAQDAIQRTVQGTVKDAEGITLPGVNIIVKGTQEGAMTNENGAFEIRVPAENAELVFSFVGYVSQTIPVGNSTTLDVVLESDVKTLDEVVVVGYGTQSRRNVTGSVAKIDMKETENLPNINVTQALRGRVAGVQFTDNGRPGQNGSILIRGPGSLSASNNPLIILDGIFFNGSMLDINPNDIESIEVLKDASAAAIYGSRAANGVILITSKKGKTEKPNININTFIGVSDWTAKLKLLSPERYLERARAIRTQRGIPFDPEDLESYLTLTEAKNYREGKIVDPYDAVSQQGRISSTDVSLSGNTNRTNYYVSAAYVKERGVVLNDELERMSFRVNLENEITDWLSIGVNSMFSQSDQSGVPASIALTPRQSPFGTWYREDGTPTQYTVPEDQGASANPIRNSYLSDDLDIRNNLFSNFYTIIDIPGVEGLTFRANFSGNHRWIRDYNATRQDPHLQNTNTTSASKRNWKASDWVIENILNYDFNLGEDHSLDATLMYGVNKNSSETTTANAEQLTSDLFGWNNLGIGGILTNSSSAEEVSGVSSMARLNYRFKEKYLLTLTARRDGSSVFARNNKYATFPSAALSWIATEENFLSDVRFLDFLKVRASYGAVGNQAISPYQSLDQADITRYVFGDGGPSVVGIYPSSISNTNLKWETTYITNLAIDFNLFKNRIGGTVEIYDMDTRDLLVERSLPIMTGYTSIWTNLGQVNNKGIEVTLNTTNLKKGKFEWSSNLVFSHNKNRIVSIYGMDADGDGAEDDDISNGWFIGHPIDVYYDYVFDGIYQEGDDLPPGYDPGFARFKDLNNDGTIEADNDRTIIGQGGQPKYRWGLTNNFSYGNFQLSVFINAMQGWIATFNELDHYDNSLDPIRPANRLDAGWWTPENRSNTRPSLNYSRGALGHNWYLSRNFVRIQDVALSYTMPKTFLTRHKLSNLSFFLSGKNLYTFTDWLGTNPEAISSDRYPMTTSYTLGLRLGF